MMKDMRTEIERLIDLQDDISKEDRKSLLNRLSVYHEELKFQNDELMRINLEMEESKKDFNILFMELPLPLLILDEELIINQYNLLAEELFNNSFLEGLDFKAFVDPHSQDDLYLFFKKSLSDPMLKRTVTLNFNIGQNKIQHELHVKKMNRENEIQYCIIVV